MRKSINGLSGIVADSFRLDPFDAAVFAFCNKSRNRLKILEWDGDGFWLYFKRLEKGRFQWPLPGDEPTMTLTGEDLAVLLGGVRVGLKLRAMRFWSAKSLKIVDKCCFPYGNRALDVDKRYPKPMAPIKLCIRKH